MSRVIIPPHQGVNQSQDKYQFNHQENTKGQETTNFSSEVHATPLSRRTTKCWSTQWGLACQQAREPREKNWLSLDLWYSLGD